MFNNKSIDSYLESARKFKSPVSTEKMRSLIEMKDLKSSVHQPFFSKKGIKIMTYTSVIIASLVILATNLGILENTSPKTSITPNMNKNSKISTNTVLPTANVQFVPKKQVTDLASNSVKTATNESNTKKAPNISINGINSIKLTEQELNEFGISYDSIEIDGKFKPGIGYWEIQTAKSAAYNIFAKEQSSHKIVQLPSDLPIAFLKNKPNLITNFDGTKRLFNQFGSQNNAELDEFMVFNQSLKSLYYLDFNQDYIPKQIPDEIRWQLAELEKLTADYQSIKESNIESGNRIDRKLKDVYQYFSILSKSDSIEQKKIDLTPEDSNLSSVIVLYPETIPNITDSTEKEFLSKMAKMGIKIVYAKHRLTMQEYLKQNFKELESQLTSFRTQIDNFVMFNKMVGIEIPYKNDPNNNGLIFWYYPNPGLADALPERYKSSLAKEFKLLENESAVCGAKPPVEPLYMDIWRACSGAVENLRVFPNPVKDQLNIKFELKENRTMSFAVHELTGAKIKDLSVNQKSSFGTNSFSFDVSQLKTGMYLLVASSSAGENAVQRIIKE